MKQPRTTHAERKLRRQQMASLVQSGTPLQSVATQFNVGVTTVSTACKEFGVSIPKLSFAKISKTESKYVLNAVRVIGELINSDKSYVEIGKSVGISDHRVAKIADLARQCNIALPEWRSSGGGDSPSTA